MLEWIHTKGVREHLRNAKKETHVLPLGEHFVLTSSLKR